MADKLRAQAYLGDPQTNTPSLIDLFFNEKSITFHSICYRRGGTDKYRAGYALIRTITWKLQNAGINEPLYVLFDNDGNLGDKEAREIRKIAELHG